MYKEVGVLYLGGGGGGGVIHSFWYLGEGGWKWQDIKYYTFDLFTLSITIH